MAGSPGRNEVATERVAQFRAWHVDATTASPPSILPTLDAVELAKHH